MFSDVTSSKNELKIQLHSDKCQKLLSTAAVLVNSILQRSRNIFFLTQSLSTTVRVPKLKSKSNIWTIVSQWLAEWNNRNGTVLCSQRELYDLQWTREWKTCSEIRMRVFKITLRTRSHDLIQCVFDMKLDNKSLQHNLPEKNVNSTGFRSFLIWGTSWWYNLSFVQNTVSMHVPWVNGIHIVVLKMLSAILTLSFTNIQWHLRVIPCHAALLKSCPFGYKPVTRIILKWAAFLRFLHAHLPMMLWQN